mgnify:CR=1 FL=1
MVISHHTELDAELCVGSCPGSVEDVLYLDRSLGVRAVVSLQSDEDLRVRGLDWNVLWRLYLSHGISASRVPIQDFEPADLARHLDRGVEAVRKACDAGRRVYVHCNAGLNRSPSVVIAYLVSARSWTVAEATAWVKERHDCVPYPDVLNAWASGHGFS